MRLPSLLVTAALAGAAGSQSTLACTKLSLPAFVDSSYYAPANGLTGNALKLALNDIIDGHVVHTYSCVWTILEETDVDPANASNVIDFYSRRSIPKADRDTGGNTPNAWNREHVWANSHGFPNGGNWGYTDVHHLRAADKSVNADRADFDFAYGGSQHPECTGCKWNTALGTWESPDLVKGDTARMMFYMATRYDTGDGNGTLDLELVDSTTNSGSGSFGDLCDLVQWHVNDPVSAAEQLRNTQVYAWQGNRNPFIDHPEWVVQIWGPGCGISPPAPVPTQIPLPLWLEAAAALLFSLPLFRLRPR
jgi:serine protease